MVAEGAVGILYRRELSEAQDKEGARRAKIKSLKIRESVHSCGRGFVDEVIGPSQRRPKTIRALSLLENKRDTNPPKEHGNIPL
jgi:propionyl-CoA carboxylase beta chain